MPLASSSQQLDDRCTCVCKQNFGRPHIVSLATWYRHLHQAETDEEKERIRAGKILHDSNARASEPPSIRRAAVLRGLAQRAQEGQTIRRTGRRKRARMSKTEPPDDDMHIDNDNDSEPRPPTPEQRPPTPEPRLPTPEPRPPTPDPRLPTPDPRLPTPDPRLPTPELRPPTPEPDHDIQFERRNRPIIDLEALAQSATMPKMQETMAFVLALKNASLEDEVVRMSDEAVARLRNPPRVLLEINNPGIRHSISMYLALEHASQEAYNRMRRSTMRNFAGAPSVDDVQSFYNVERLHQQMCKGLMSPGHHLNVLAATWMTWPSVDSDSYYTISRHGDSIPVTPKHVGVKRSRSEPPSPHLVNSESSSESQSLAEHTSDGPPKIKKRRRQLFRRLKISSNGPNEPFEYTPEYLATLATQCKTPESPSPSTKFQTETLAVPVDFLQDLVDARWKAERARCDAEHTLHYGRTIHPNG